MAEELLRPCQISAIEKMKNGCILCGGVGSGKSRTSIGYFCKKFGDKPKDLYIITTPKKRDDCEWEPELNLFGLSIDISKNSFNNVVKVDSWNNITKYTDVSNSFFIFDEQRLVGSGAWVKSFYKIADKNFWILLSATPGDCWADYIPVFVANGFFKNKTHFVQDHVVYARWSKYPKIERYLGEGKLQKLRNSILVDIEMSRAVDYHDIDIYVEYDRTMYKTICKDRWNIWENKPLQNASEFCQALRRVVNVDESRQKELLEIKEKHDKLIIFYNYNYELDILRSIFYGPECIVAEWNGQKHEKIPDSNNWVYLVQYTAGCEGWNCIETNAIVFWSLNYSYRIMTQAKGRIDRMNTPYKDLYYYYMKSTAGIDISIARAIRNKKIFNERSFSTF